MKKTGAFFRIGLPLIALLVYAGASILIAMKVKWWLGVLMALGGIAAVSLWFFLKKSTPQHGGGFDHTYGDVNNKQK